MDRDVEALMNTPPFSWTRFGATVLSATAIIGIGAVLVRTLPDSGYRAGHDAATEKGELWIREEISRAGGATEPVCDGLLRDAEKSVMNSLFDAVQFASGCSAAIDSLLAGTRG